VYRGIKAEGGTRGGGKREKSGELVSSSRRHLITDDHLPRMRLTTDCTGRCIQTLTEFSEREEFADTLI